MYAHIPSQSETLSFRVKEFPDRNKVCSSKSPSLPFALPVGAVDHIPALPMLSLGAKGRANSAISVPLNLIPPSLCLQNPTINHGDVQAVRTLIIWLRGNLNTSFGGKSSDVSRQQNP